MNVEHFVRNQRTTGVTVQKCVGFAGEHYVSVCDWKQLRTINLQFTTGAAAEAFANAAAEASNCGRQEDWNARPQEGEPL